MTENNETRSHDEPDEFDSLVLDEDFIKGGISEASLPGHQRAISLPHQQPPKRSRPVENFSSADDERASLPLPGSRFMRSTGLVLGVAVLVMVSALLAGFFRVGSGAADPTGFAGGDGSQNFLFVAAELPSNTAVGTCFDIPATQTVATVVAITAETCSTAHEFELVALTQGEGANATYPDRTYWISTIQAFCIKSLEDYTGLTASAWPASLSATAFVPSRSAWSNGDRAVSCVADSRPSSDVTVRGLIVSK